MKISVKTACVSRLSVSCDYGKTYLKLRKTKVRTTKENTCVRVSFSIKLKACSFIKKNSGTAVFDCEFCEGFHNNLFIEHLGATSSELTTFVKVFVVIQVLMGRLDNT